jgi:hypothetical protein
VTVALATHPATVTTLFFSLLTATAYHWRYTYVANPKRQPTQEKKSWQNQQSVFAKCELTKADSEAFLNWTTGLEKDFATALSDVTQDLWRVSLKVDVNNNCYMASFTQQDFKNVNANVVLTSRSDDLEEAFWMCVYKIYVLWEGQRLPTEAESRSWG